MRENIYERIHTALSWKRIVAFNVVLLLVLVVPISVRLAQEDTENRSSAAEEVPIVTPPPNYPASLPRIERVSMFFGKVGDTIVIFGANFGDYQWGSRVYVGESEVIKENVVRWSNNILEVKIPESARTGAVWVSINNQEARWEGSLLLYDVARAAQVGLSRLSSNQGSVYATNAAGIVSGMIEISYVSEPFIISSSPNVIITEQSLLSDSLGKKIKFAFTMTSPLTSNRSELIQFSYPGIGVVEIIRAELRDGGGRMLSIFADPLGVKLLP